MVSTVCSVQVLSRARTCHIHSHWGPIPDPPPPTPLASSHTCAHTHTYAFNSFPVPYSYTLERISPPWHIVKATRSKHPHTPGSQGTGPLDARVGTIHLKIGDTDGVWLCIHLRLCKRMHAWTQKHPQTRTHKHTQKTKQMEKPITTDENGIKTQ